MFPEQTVVFLVTDRIRSTTERLCFDTCLSICLSTPRVVPQPGPAWGVPLLGYPSQVQPGGYPLLGDYPTSGTPPSDLGGGVPHFMYPPVRPGWGYPCWGVTPPQVPPQSDLGGRYPCWGIQPRGYCTSSTPPSDLAGGYHTSSTPHQTWPGGTPPWAPPHVGPGWGGVPHLR